MISKLKAFFEKELSLKSKNEPQEDINAKLQKACAILLLEISKADYQETKDEKDRIRKILQDKFTLSDAQLNELIALSEDEGNEVTSMYPLTSLINEHYSYEQKLGLLDLLWQVAYADGELSKYEDHVIRNVAELLYVAHSDFIKSKLSQQP
ncbi:TerB family tellurite resistance protein [Glaciecola petra]|uniref:TerB family tellurite resistance protein n=1 Tax=Glaciecola petra TaxID=3075602 RepID=A0ABU2ZUE6_9ALTE|nr:TerB family tellurite resistance protein [Aestuariibacter sp. P117]MDT0596262.1 TerB family tellurite resistance protein [Aestuariibacter sp. P117]